MYSNLEHSRTDDDTDTSRSIQDALFFFRTAGASQRLFRRLEWGQHPAHTLNREALVLSCFRIVAHRPTVLCVALFTLF